MDTLPGASGGRCLDTLIRAHPAGLGAASVSQTLSEDLGFWKSCGECWLPFCPLFFSASSRRAAVYLLVAMTDAIMHRAKEPQARLSTKGMVRKEWRADSRASWRDGTSTPSSTQFGPGFGRPGGSDSKESACNAEDLGSITGLGRSPGEGNSYRLQYLGLENSMDRGAWWATVHGVTKRRTWLND